MYGKKSTTNGASHIILARFDKFHRLIRDFKLSVQHCKKGIFNLAMFFSAYLYGLSYKPFGSGMFHSQKQRLMEIWASADPTSSQVFRKYEARIATDLGLQTPSTDDERKTLLEAMLALPGCEKKNVFPEARSVVFVAPMPS